MSQMIAPEQIPALFRPGMTVYLPGCGGESSVVVRALRAAPGAAAGVNFIGVYIPGVNGVDYAGLDPTARLISNFMTPTFRESFAAGRVDLLPLSYVEMYAYLAERAAVDLAVLQVAPPDENGLCSLGIAADFTPAVMLRAKRRLAHVNPLMPRVADGPSIPYAALDYVVAEPAPLLRYESGPVNAATREVAAHIAGLIRDGDTLQLGLGNLQRAVLEAVGDKRNLKLHTGMISDPVVDLATGGALAPGPAITTGVALGTEKLYDWVRNNPQVRFRPVGHTHALATLVASDNLVAINSIIEIDLFAEANAEMIGGRQVSAPGGLVDFLRGARRARGGRAIVALPATAAEGAVTRIVPRLAAATLTSIARADVDYVATEYGVAALGALSVHERAAALIRLAAPEVRDMLAEAWAQMVKTL